MARKITVEELQKMIAEALEDPKDPAKQKVKAGDTWASGDAVENEIDWMKALKLKEMFAHLIEDPSAVLFGEPPHPPTPPDDDDDADITIQIKK